MINKIRVNNKNGTLITVEFTTDELNNYYLISTSNNVKDIFVDYEQTNAQGFIEVMDIDLKQVII